MITFIQKKERPCVFIVPLFPWSPHLGPQSRCGTTAFCFALGRGGIRIFQSGKPSSKCGESAPVDISWAISEGGMQYPDYDRIAAKNGCSATAF